MADPELSPDQEQPSFDFDFNATPEQREALEGFLSVASSVSPAEVDMVIAPGIKLYDKNPSLVSETAAYLEANPGGFAVLSTFKKIDDLRADRVASFDETTEQEIEDDPENQRLLQKLSTEDGEQYRTALRRNRFRILGRRAATATESADDHAA